jgi:hypothetical protein
MKKVIFTGCSFTSGAGWQPGDAMVEVRDHPDLWVNLCHSGIEQIKNLELHNAGQGGASNTEIFENTVNHISKFGSDIEYMICQWSAMPRYRFRVGFELWDAMAYLQTNLDGKRGEYDIRLHNNETWPRSYVDDLLDRLLVLHHLQGEILKLVRYTSTITKLCKQFGINVVFINGLCPWDKNYFVRLHNVLPESYTPFTKTQILDIKNRDDKDIFKLYDLAHDEYLQAGGIDPTQWANLYEPWNKIKIDTNYDDIHPGTKSNQLYFQQIKNFFKNC